MVDRRHDLWLLIRLAAQNVGRRRLRAIFLSAAVMLGVGIAFASFVAGWALRDGMTTSFSRMGADLVLVPRATLVNITSSLLTVQHTDETLPANLAARVAAIPGVGKVAPQRIVPALVEGNAANLIAFDPTHDLSVLTWLAERQSGPVEGLIAGGGLAARLGESVSVCGMPMRIYGRFGKTGVGPFDDSYFLSFSALADMVSFCRTADARGVPRPTAKPQDKPQDEPPVPSMSHAGDVCSPDLALDRVSAFLLQLSPGARVDEVKCARAASRRQDRRRQHRDHLLAAGVEHAPHRHCRLHRIPAHCSADPSVAVVLGDRAGALPRSRSPAGDGGEAQSGDDDHSHRSGDHYRLGRHRRTRLRRCHAVAVRPLARFLFRPARRAVRLAAADGAADQRHSRDLVFDDPRPGGRFSAGMARAPDGALRADSGRRPMT